MSQNSSKLCYSELSLLVIMLLKFILYGFIQVVDQGQNGETLVIGLILRRYIMHQSWANFMKKLLK